MTTPIILETVEDDGLGPCRVCGELLARGEQIHRTPSGMSHDDCDDDPATTECDADA